MTRMRKAIYVAVAVLAVAHFFEIFAGDLARDAGDTSPGTVAIVDDGYINGYHAVKRGSNPPLAARGERFAGDFERARFASGFRAPVFRVNPRKSLRIRRPPFRSQQLRPEHLR